MRKALPISHGSEALVLDMAVPLPTKHIHSGHLYKFTQGFLRYMWMISTYLPRVEPYPGTPRKHIIRSI